MCGPRVEAHDGPMFTTYDTARALMAERQDNIRREASQHHLIRGRRRTRGGSAELRAVRPTSQTEPLPAVASHVSERVAA